MAEEALNGGLRVMNAVIHLARRPPSMVETSVGACVKRGRPDSPARAQTNFRGIASAALSRLPDLVRRWLPDGRREGPEWVALNPTRVDRHLGSFRINLHTGRWADFATGDGGGDAISLAAYAFGLSQGDAARRIAEMLGIDGGVG